MSSSSSSEDHLNLAYAADLLQALFKSEAHYDVTIKVSPGSGRSWRVHKCVLSTASSYFEAMFSGHFRESAENEILLSDIPDDDTLEMVLWSVYGGPLKLTETNVLTVLKISNLLQLTRIENECWEWMELRMDDFDNSLDVLALSDQLGQRPVYEQALARVAYNFRHIRLQTQFQELDAKLVSKLLSSDDLRVNSEQDVVEALLDWVNFDRSDRMKYLPNLIRTIRLPLVTREYLSSVFSDVELSSDSVEFIERGLQSFVPTPHPRKTIFGKIAAISYGQDKLLKVHAYCPVSKQWIKDVIKNRSDSMHTICFILKHTLYSFATMIKEFHLASDSWKNFTWFRIARYDFAYAMLDNDLYIIGGRKHRIERVVQKLNLISKEWTIVAELNVERELAAALAFNSTVYVFGGRTNDLILNLVEVYNVQENVWENRSAMLIPRMMPEVVQCNNRIYVFGGFQGIDIRLFVTSVEVYDPDTDAWKLCGSLGDESKTYSISVTVFGDEIYYMLNNETNCQFGTFDPANGESSIITFAEKVRERDSLDLDLAYCTIHGVLPLSCD